LAVQFGEHEVVVPYNASLDSRIDLVAKEHYRNGGIKLVVITGVPSAQPVAPVPVYNDRVRQEPLATVLVRRHQAMVQECHITSLTS
jgi:hypothetical protein